MENLFEEFGHKTWLPFPVIVARLILASILGGIIGFEREWQQRPAGLRTHMLVCLAAALIAIVTIEITHVTYFQDEAVTIDPLRLVEAVTAGVAFLAAGLIVFARGEVQGLTTGRRHVAGVGHRSLLRPRPLADRNLRLLPRDDRARTAAGRVGTHRLSPTKPSPALARNSASATEPADRPAPARSEAVPFDVLSGGLHVLQASLVARAGGSAFLPCVQLPSWKCGRRAIFRLPIGRPPCYQMASGGYDVMVACQLPKLNARVRFPLPAPTLSSVYGFFQIASATAMWAPTTLICKNRSRS